MKSFNFVPLLFFAFSLSLNAVSAASTNRARVRIPHGGSCDLINLAIQALPSNGGDVILPADSFECREPIVIDRDHVRVHGQGRDKTFISAVAGIPLPVIIIGSTVNVVNRAGVPYPDHVVRDVELSSLSVDGAYHANANPGAFECYDPLVRKSLACGNDAGFFIRNNGITIRRGDDIRVRDFIVHGAFSGGIVLEKKSTRVVVDSFRTYDNWFDGIAGCEGTANRFDYFESSQNQYSGISLDCGFEGNSFSNGTLTNNKDNGVFSANVGRNSFSHMVIRENAKFGFFIDGKRDPQGVPIAESCDHISISGSLIQAGDNSGVRINSTCQDIRIDTTEIQQPFFNCISAENGAAITQKNVSCRGPLRSRKNQFAGFVSSYDVLP
jgi:hypothetical protein